MSCVQGLVSHCFQPSLLRFHSVLFSCMYKPNKKTSYTCLLTCPRSQHIPQHTPRRGQRQRPGNHQGQVEGGRAQEGQKSVPSEWVYPGFYSTGEEGEWVLTRKRALRAYGFSCFKGRQALIAILVSVSLSAVAVYCCYRLGLSWHVCDRRRIGGDLLGFDERGQYAGAYMTVV